VWDVAGRIVAYANCGRETAHGGVISAVYTPPSERGKGFASALVSRVTQEQLENGKQFCCLFAARDAPIPNHVYRKVGYEFHSRFSLWRLD
jgi:predicted GNAT family acetyltransferase